MFADRYTARLTECYDEQALHFSHTRKKHRPEIAYIYEFIKNYRTQKQPSSSPTLLEVGCGAGRGYEALRDVLPEAISYTGIDIAPGMIRLAKKSFATAQRKVAEMQSYLKNIQPETLDMLIGIASVQHLFSPKERSLFFAHAYQALQR